MFLLGITLVFVGARGFALGRALSGISLSP
jgi:hypothetical protein